MTLKKTFNTELMISKQISKYLILIFAFSTIMTSCADEVKKESAESTVNNSSFVNTTWLLEKLNNNQINYPADYKQNYIVFTGEAEGFRFSGFAGCNNISGNYDVGDHNEIGLGNIISTKKMCSFDKLENEYLKMLSDATSFKIDGFYMKVYNGNDEIAFFKDAKELRTH